MIIYLERALIFFIFAAEFQTVIMKQEDIRAPYKSTQLISILNKNAEIISELKKFMEEVSTKTSLRAHYCCAKNSFIRERILTLTCTVMLIINGLKCSLQVALPHCFEYFSQGLSCSRQAFCEQRVKWKPAFFHDLNQVPVSGFYRSYADRVKHWKGMVL